MLGRLTRAAVAAALVTTGLTTGLLLAGPAPQAAAHVERPAYWPDPKPDCSISPCAGGKVPDARSLASALDRGRVGQTRVVCQPDSLQRLRRSVAHARRHGYDERPTVHRRLTERRARTLLRVNERLFERCRYRQIQAAVTASGNNDRVVVMPGLYLEPHSRKQPTYDERCAPYRMKSDSGDPGALSHEYQIHCPNDANLVAVIGRGPDTAPTPDVPHEDRHGIPNVGDCIRCNLQLEGSGVSADDVVVEAGDPRAGNGGPSAAGHKKDVGIFVDRADGFVLRNVTVRHAREHNIYVIETDGYRLEQFKAFYGGAYGVLTFVGDHGLVQRCEAAGSGDSGLYPGSGADSTTNRYKPFYPKWRFSQTFRLCDSHHNTGGFSGTNSHGTLVERNNFFKNALGYTTDVFTAPGHPGFPQHGNVVRHNRFYSNNFNVFEPDSGVDPFIPAPVGTGLWLAGGNQNNVHHNWFYDNWRRGVMLFAVPDATVCTPVVEPTPVPGCNPLAVSTSFDNRFHHNRMGVNPDGLPARNGLDFWWDSFVGNTGNCWWANSGPGGRAVRSMPSNLPDCDEGTNPSSSIGLGNVVAEAELIGCLLGIEVEGPSGGPLCTWGQTPPRPGMRAAGDDPSALAAPTEAQRQLMAGICWLGLAARTCAPYDAETEPVESGRTWARSTELPAAYDGVEPVATQARLSELTCSWWRQADRAHRLGAVDRIEEFATGPIDGSVPYGFGAGMPDGWAVRMFQQRCSMFEAGGFALYKLYGAAAPFAAVAD
ncbi:hypothetical protein HNR19_002164 [Nocardioides thalensis]|uniref:Right handed beta helix domain-containing protein n=1 Tax=Nocardioides thalensis TaxID=1914755 RepID=A0A853C374_9ACTN|nr:right-handed parallel beta-helix repeat-containing protein [Nocardioides thalensis]NYJ01466.1 hypothetical protein [Nocardioides thalensis]